MKQIIKIGVAILAIVIAWNIFKSLLGLLLGVALAVGLYVGATKLLENK